MINDLRHLTVYLDARFDLVFRKLRRGTVHVAYFIT
jgi:hypothetical protein